MTITSKLNCTRAKQKLLTALSTSLLSLVTFSAAHAMLPTPEPELDSPTSPQNAAVIQQASHNPMAGQNHAAVSTKVTAFLVGMGDDGQPVLVPITATTQLQRGNVIEYQGHFTNTSADRQRKMTVTMSIPNEVKLMGGIAPDFPLATVDGQHFNRTPLRSRVGNEIQEVPLEYYKALRWEIEGLGLGETAVVKYQALVR